MMDDLLAYLRGFRSSVCIDLDNRAWHKEARIPRVPGWYFITTDTPLSVLNEQTLWADTYITRREGETRKVKNYDIASRARRYSNELAPYVNVTEVYSGMASKLIDRAREHTFPDPGTAALALSRYPALRQYQWRFEFLTLERFALGRMNVDLLLMLGEQLWRGTNGWPILCAE
jgi:hypothetical protein